MRVSAGWTLIIVAVLPVAALPRALGDGSPPELRVLFPQAGATLADGQVDMICVLPEGARAPALRVDGKRVAWGPYALPVLAARLDLAPGPHRIALGKTVLTVTVDPEATEAFRSHAGGEGWKDCTVCHEATDEGGRQALGDLKAPTACQQCHSADDFQLAHFHPEKPLAGCHQCHALHGASATSLLKAPVKQLCAACHD
ncbi:MAG: hypothetical protein FJX74_02855 [Armatimonadetes bacterium]|nr:hypothetical protein [Armatimonadota bacterium]